jgi:hypothetical protein
LRDTGVQSQPIDDRPTDHDGRSSLRKRVAKSFHGCALPHPTARSLKTAKGELASLSNAQVGFPDLDPASRPKLRYRFLCPVSLSLACRPTQPHVWWPNNGVRLWRHLCSVRRPAKVTSQPLALYTQSLESPACGAAWNSQRARFRAKLKNGCSNFPGPSTRGSLKPNLRTTAPVRGRVHEESGRNGSATFRRSAQSASGRAACFPGSRM